jgi:hypothetical protein
MREAGRRTGARIGGVKTEGGNADMRGGGGGLTGDRQNDIPSFSRKFFLFRSRDKYDLKPSQTKPKHLKVDNLKISPMQ